MSFKCCVHLCAQCPALLELAHQAGCPLCSMRKTQCYCVQFWGHQLWERAANWRESRWSQGAGTRDTSGQAEATGLVWAALETLIAVFHLADYRGDRARLSLKMPRERTRACSCSFVQGKLWPHSREKGESGRDGTFMLQMLETQPWGNWSDFEVNLIPNRWGGPLEVIYCHELLK